MDDGFNLVAYTDLDLNANAYKLTINERLGISPPKENLPTPESRIQPTIQQPILQKVIGHEVHVVTSSSETMPSSAVIPSVAATLVIASVMDTPANEPFDVSASDTEVQLPGTRVMICCVMIFSKSF